MAEAAKLFLIDGHALCYRSFYAIRELSTSKGQATNAVYGFVSTLRKILKSYKPNYLAVCFDSKETTFREKKFAQYKIQRPRMPEDLRDQIPIIKDVLKAFNITVCEQGGFEADDLMGTLAQQASKKLEVVIVSDDKDMYQLASPHVAFFSVRNDQLYREADLKKKLGFDPKQIVDFIGLAGDSSDNIPGVEGIGKVTATKLLNDYKDLESVYKKVDALSKAKVKEKLLAQKDRAFLSKDLALLDTKAPIKCKLDDLKVQEPDNNRLFELFTQLEFRRLAQEFSSENHHDASLQTKALAAQKDIDRFVEDVQKQKQFAFLLDGIEADKPSETVYLCAGKEKIYTLALERVGSLKKIWEDKAILKVGYNLKESAKAFLPFDQVIAGSRFDVLLAGYLLSPSVSIDALAWEFLNSALPEENKREAQVDALYKLQNVLAKQLNDKSLDKLFDTIEMPLSDVLFDMETHGVNLDIKLLKELSKTCGAKIDELTKSLYKIAGEEFNLNSPKQLSHILFEKLGLAPVRKTKTGFSTDEGVLTILASQHEIPAMILDYRQLSKLKSTYIDALPELVNKKTGRLHAQFVQTGAETGRLSSRHPNLQNIPVRTELGRQIRKAIIPSSKDLILMAADYSQIELRILAHLSKDKNLIKAFKTGQDIHQFTAALMFDVDESKVTQEMRYSAKRVNFGIVYGMSAFGLAKDLSVSQPEAQDFIDRYFMRYPLVKDYMDHTIKECEKQGFVTTLLNRRRYIPEIKSKNNSIRQFAQRQAINTPVQGSAADLMKLAMIKVAEEMTEHKLKSTMLITVHDELVFEVPAKEKTQLVKMVRELMANSLKLNVPIEVSVKTGKNWLDMEEAS